MYKGVVNSPETTITNNINGTDTLIYVLDETRIPEPPNLMTLGTGTSAETVKVTEVNGNMLTVVRGFQGTPKSWNAGTVIARNFTEYDYDALKENIEGLDENIGDLDELDTTEKDNIVGAINEVKDDVDNIKLTADNVEYNNTESGLEAEDVQGAIDEVVDDLDSHLADYTNLKDRVDIIEGSYVTSWEQVQTVVRLGLANKVFSVGDQLMSNYGSGQITWEVIGLNVDTPADSNFVYSMTIQTKDCLHNIQFDAPEPNNPDSNRKSYGSNRYIHSAVRQWLNSNESIFNWQSQHQYDATPTDSLDLYNGAGFLYRLDPELVSVIGLVNKRVARNTSVDGGGQDSFTDKVFLLSRVEAGFGTEGDETGEFVYPFYDGIANAGRIKQLNGSNRLWWLRSPFVSDSYYVRRVSVDGSLYGYYARTAYGVSPACVII